MRSLLRVLLRHVEQDQAPVLVGNGGANSHMAQHGSHHARGKLLRRSMATAAIGVKTLLTLHSLIVSIAAARD